MRCILEKMGWQSLLHGQMNLNIGAPGPVPVWGSHTLYNSALRPFLSIARAPEFLLLSRNRFDLIWYICQSTQIFAKTSYVPFIFISIYYIKQLVCLSLYLPVWTPGFHVSGPLSIAALGPVPVEWHQALSQFSGPRPCPSIGAPDPVPV